MTNLKGERKIREVIDQIKGLVTIPFFKNHSRLMMTVNTLIDNDGPFMLTVLGDPSPVHDILQPTLDTSGVEPCRWRG